MTTAAALNETHDTHLLIKKESIKDKQISFLKGQIILNPSITKLNFFCFMLFNIYLGLILTPVDLLQASVLGIVYKLDTDHQSYVTTIVQFSQLVLQLLTAPLVGYICDKYGRRIPICSGLVFLCCTIFFTTNFPNPYPYYIINQCLQSISYTALGIPPLLADYVDSSTHGRMSGLISVLVSSGSFLITLLNSMQQDTVSNLHKKFFFIGALALGLAFLIIPGIKGGTYYKNIPQSSESQESASFNEETTEQNAAQTEVQLPEPEPGLMAGLKEVKNPWIFAGYIVNFLLTSSGGLTGFILVTYVIHLTQDVSKANLAYVLVDIVLLSSIINSIFFGYVADKFNKFRLIIFIIVCSIISASLLTFIKSPTEPLAYISMVLFGVATSGYMVFSGQLLNKYPSPKFRGSVLAVGGMISLGGTATVNILGVYLLHWNVLYPFFICLGSSVVALLILVILYICKKDIMNKT